VYVFDTSELRRASSPAAAPVIEPAPAGVSTTCSARNHTCSSLVRMTSLTMRSLLPSSPASAASRAMVRASLSTISCAWSSLEICTGASSRPLGGRGTIVISATSAAIAILIPTST
jgi:hypothetical protein